ncbi:uncharacterized protein LOC121331983 isoform X1 [Onychostruthus taczanowskii]|uniref:uncharacterized protein LOC121331983 isoform X1 n=1 Tax=Onychostruthus taczanowskii TaxID=356909 RepID=UPI001B8075E3|nr:uncharacterized protein LOC121331983 isoform X1 [Onychostruthus taczanowskii]
MEERRDTGGGKAGRRAGDRGYSAGNRRHEAGATGHGAGNAGQYWRHGTRSRTWELGVGWFQPCTAPGRRLCSRRAALSVTRPSGWGPPAFGPNRPGDSCPPVLRLPRGHSPATHRHLHKKLWPDSGWILTTLIWTQLWGRAAAPQQRWKPGIPAASMSICAGTQRWTVSHRDRRGSCEQPGTLLGSVSTNNGVNERETTDSKQVPDSQWKINK